MTDWIYDKQNNCLRFGKFCIEPPDEVNPEWYAYYRSMPAEWYLGQGTLEECIQHCKEDSAWERNKND